MTSPPRHLGLGSAVAIYAGIILGSGIFVAPSAVAAAAGTGAPASLVWLAGAVVAACGASCYAECAARRPSNGGFFVFHREAFGPAVAFVGGWAALFVTYPATIAAIALVLASYLAEAAGLAGYERGIAAAAIVAAGALNAAGLRTGPRAQRTLTTLKLAALSALAVAAFAAAAAPAAVASASSARPPAGGWLLALTIVLWTYDGWSDVTLVAGEVVNPGRNIGRAVLLGTGLLFVTYALVQLAVSAALGAGAAASMRPVADAVTASLGAGAGRAVATLVVVCTFGSIVGIVLTVSRLGQAMAAEGAFVPWFGVLHPRWGTPARSIAAMTGASLVYVASSEFREVVAYFTFTVWIFYGLTAVALLILRRRKIGDPPEWRAPLGIVPPLVVLAVGLYLTTGLIRENPRSALIGAAILGSAVPVYLLTARGAASRRR